MRKLLIWCMPLLFVFSCAKIPVQSVVLAEAVQTEGERMHKLNLLLLNRIFDAKRETIEAFIRNDYTPGIVAAFTKNVERDFPGTDFKKEFPELMNAISPKINKRRDSLVNALELEKEKLVDKLTADYSVFNNAAFELKKLLESAVKIDKEKLTLFNQAKALSNNRIDFNSIEQALDRFIHSSGNVGNNLTELSNFINSKLNNK